MGTIPLSNDCDCLGEETFCPAGSFCYGYGCQTNAGSGVAIPTPKPTPQPTMLSEFEAAIANAETVTFNRTIRNVVLFGMAITCTFFAGKYVEKKNFWE